MSHAQTITALLRAHAEGRGDALEQLVPLVYEQLRHIARRHLRRAGPAKTLDTTALVHETFLKLAGAEQLQAKDRAHFFAVCALAMRQVIVSRARSRTAAKRGGGEPAVPLDEGRVAAADRDAVRLLDVDRALTALAAKDASLARIVELRFFAGLSEPETAEALGMSLRSVQRGWTRARAWLHVALAGAEW